MTEAAALELRHVRLAEPVTLRPASLGPTPEGGGEEGVFVALDDSPPVRTVLAVVEGGRRRALEVAWVVEVAERDEVKGFYGRWVSDEALERAAKVGTEHLEDGMPVVQPVVYDNSAVLDVSDTSMAMPAPVIVLDDDTGVVDVDDEDDDGEARYEASTPEGDASAAPAEALAAAEAATSEDAVRAEAPAADADRATGSAEQGDAAEQSGSSDRAEAADADDAAETSTDSGEAPSESSDGDASESRSKGSRKKRGRRRR